MYDQQDVDPKKVRPIQVGAFLRKYVARRLLALSVRSELALRAVLRVCHLPSAPLRRMDDRLNQWTAGPNQSRREKLLWDDRTEGGARGAVAVSPEAHGGSSVETLERVLC